MRIGPRSIGWLQALPTDSISITGSDRGNPIAMVHSLAVEEGQRGPKEKRP